MIFRKKMRYLLVESSEPHRLGDARNLDSLKEQLHSFMGQLAYFKANPQLTTILNQSVFVMGVNRGYERNVTLALAFVKEIEAGKMGFYTIRISGSVRGTKNAFRKLYG